MSSTLNMATKPSRFRYFHLETIKRNSEPKNNVLDWTRTFVERLYSKLMVNNAFTKNDIDLPYQ